jgi:hypothetical protein
MSEYDKSRKIAAIATRPLKKAKRQQSKRRGRLNKAIRPRSKTCGTIVLK